MDKISTELEQIVDLLDSALTSQDERVVNTLRQLLMIAALTNSNDGNQTFRPLRGLLTKVDAMEAKFRQIESYIQRSGQKDRDSFYGKFDYRLDEIKVPLTGFTATQANKITGFPKEEILKSMTSSVNNT